MEIHLKPWDAAKEDAFLVRQAVFIHEQGVPVELEVDELDQSATHALAYQGVQCIGTGRLVNLGAGQSQIGRMAVLAQFRGTGIGRQILKSLIDLAVSQGAKTVILHSQVSAMPFYEKLGFKPEGSNYEEAGILHRNMILLLSK